VFLSELTEGKNPATPSVIILPLVFLPINSCKKNALNNSTTENLVISLFYDIPLKSLVVNCPTLNPGLNIRKCEAAFFSSS